MTLNSCMRRMLGLALAVASLATGSADAAAPLPNIILIVADDLGHGDLGCYGQQWIKTPHIDRLAADGTRFTNFYAGAPVCAPSRCVLLTGRAPGRAYIRDNGEGPVDAALKAEFGWEFPGQRPIFASEVTIAEVLQSRGYATAAIGKWGLGHFGTSGDPTTQGFDLFFGYNCQWHAHNHYPRFLWRNRTKVEYPGNDGKSLSGRTYSQDEFTREALGFVREHQREPFFLYLPVAVPHLSLQVPEASLAAYRDTIPEAPYKHNGYLQHPTPRAAYAAMISHLDEAVGQVVKLVDELGLGAETLILFTSDNGPTYDRLGGSDSEFFNSAGGLRGLKGSVYEGGLRVPLIARWPHRIAPGGQCDEVAVFWDLMPTLAEAAATKAPAAADGLSLLPLLQGESTKLPREYVAWEFAGYGGQQAIRMGRYKGVRNNLRRPKGGKLEIYDLASDPAETTDLAGEMPELADQMLHILRTDRTESELHPLPGL